MADQSANQPFRQNSVAEDEVGTQDFLPEMVRPPQPVSSRSDSSRSLPSTSYSSAHPGNAPDLSMSMPMSFNPRGGHVTQFTPQFYDEDGNVVNLATSDFLHSSIDSVDTIRPMENEWKKRNSLYLAEFEDRGNVNRRQSSVQMNNYINALKSLGEDDDDGDDADFDFDAKVDQVVSRFLPQNGRGDRDSSMSMDMNSLADSFRSSINLSDALGAGAGSGQRFSMRMSMCSRRSTRMSLVLRQSLLGSFELDNDDEATRSVYVPDTFNSRPDRRRSTITLSTSQLLATVFGYEAVNREKEHPGRESILLRSLLEPVMADDLMMEISGMNSGDYDF